MLNLFSQRSKDILTTAMHDTCDLSQHLGYWIHCSTYFRTKLHKTYKAEDEKIHNFYTYGIHLW